MAVQRTIHDVITEATHQGGIELFHGYTYSGHPVALAAMVAALDIYGDEKLFEQARRLENAFEDAAHSLHDVARVVDIRNFGLVAGIQLEPRNGAPGARAYEAFLACLRMGVLVRYTGETLALSPPLVINESQIDQLFTTVRTALREVS